MNLNQIAVMMAQAGGAATQPDPRGQTIMLVVWIGVMIAMVYFMMIRPQQQRSRDLNKLMTGLKAGDKVTTSSGIIGVVVAVKEKSLTLRSADTKLEVVKTSIAEVTERAGEAAEA